MDSKQDVTLRAEGHLFGATRHGKEVTYSVYGRNHDYKTVEPLKPGLQWNEMEVVPAHISRVLDERLEQKHQSAVVEGKAALERSGDREALLRRLRSLEKAGERRMTRLSDEWGLLQQFGLVDLKATSEAGRVARGVDKGRPTDITVYILTITDVGREVLRDRNPRRTNPSAPTGAGLVNKLKF